MSNTVTNPYEGDKILQIFKTDDTMAITFHGKDGKEKGFYMKYKGNDKEVITDLISAWSEMMESPNE